MTYLEKNKQLLQEQKRSYLIFPMIISFLTFFPIIAEIPKYEDVKAAIISSETRLLDKNGKILHEIRTNPKERRMEWVVSTEISENLKKAVVAAEDKRFYNHSGVDWVALFSGIFSVFSTEPVRGASTITMQLASMLEEELKPKGKRRTFFQKWGQIRSAKEIEESWSKENILEVYLNLVSFRGELIGIDSASRGLFQKQAHALDVKESILLASLLKIPSSNSDRVLIRACYLAGVLETNISCADMKLFLIPVLNRPYFIKPEYTLAPHVARKLLDKDTGAIGTTLDKDLQIYSIDAIKRHLSVLSKRNVKDAAVLVVENATGNILAYVGSSGEFSSSKETDGVISKRQAGSTLKPFIYGLAIEKKLITAASTLEDIPIQIQVGNGIYSPSNYQEKFHGLVTARTALASSLNVPAVRVLDYIGVDDFTDLLGELGFQNLRESEFYGLSIALGSLDITLKDLVYAYYSLANEGRLHEIGYTQEEKHNGKQILSKETSFIISDILSDRQARSLSFGLENPLSTRFLASVKTGTSKDMRDNWCVGYTKHYTVGVWVGNFAGEPMWNVSGVTGAAPIWSEIITYLHKDIKYNFPEIPEKVIKKEVRYKDGNNFFNEYFISGTEITEPIEIITPSSNSILSPVADAMIAIDPDIPYTNQKVFFEPRFFSNKYNWFLDNKNISSATELYLWSPEAGKHILELVDENGKPVDKIKFLVR
jgi:penicillin-binding protein 1C